MKKIMFLLVAVVLGIGTMAAQKGDKSLGVNINYGTEIETVGFGAKFQYSFSDVIRGEMAFNHYLEKNHAKMWDLEATAHYLLPLSEKFTFYPLAGVCFTKVSAGGFGSSKWGANLGCGIEMPLSENLKANFDAKYQLVSDWDQAVLSIGLAYKF